MSYPNELRSQYQGIINTIPDNFTTPYEEDNASIFRKKIDSAKAFTEAYRKHMDSPVAVREAMCLKEQFPAICRDIKDYDLIAGRVNYHPVVGFGIEVYPGVNNPKTKKLDKNLDEKQNISVKEHLESGLGNSFSGFYCNIYELIYLRDNFCTDEREKQELNEMISFWQFETTRAKYNFALLEHPELINDAVSGEIDRNIMSMFFRVACVSLDFDKLLQLGIPGLRMLIQNKRTAKIKEGMDISLYDGMDIALDVLVNTCRHYESRIRNKASAIADLSAPRRIELLKMAGVLKNITERKPETFREALQLYWMYNIMAGTVNYGRIDVYLGDFFVRDIDSGIMTEEDAAQLLKSMWKIISEQQYDGWNNSRANCRMIVGGRGRRNEANADRFALFAMEVTGIMHTNEPNLTLRFYNGQNPALMEKAIDMLGEGCIHPGLYNDDAYMPWFKKAYNITDTEAEQYVPQGCGEMVVEHVSIGSPNTITNYITALDIVLHNGYDTVSKKKLGFSLGELKDFDTFDKLVDAWKKQIDYCNDIAVKRHAIEVSTEAKHAAYLFMSILTDDCIERGKSLMDGGARYLGGVVETFGLTNMADSLYAIKKTVYENKTFTIEELVEMLDCNFEGHEKEHQLLIELPKFGNDNEEVDDLHYELNVFVNQNIYDKAKAAGFHYYLNCNLNTGGISYGSNTKASADGRKFGDSLAVGNAPTAGYDRSSATAVLNSMLRQNKLHAGFVHNLKLSKKMFQGEKRALICSLFKSYFDRGGIQLMVTALNKEDLENALKEPEKYTHLMVRVGGWTARYVELPYKYQIDILNRKMYC